ncbi:hypothetical protein EZV73_25210 [Acidaminobacter sp. JC074]|uniref:hypothetical protein n=1 Tax=Acidaminobacter sp. JC074 TaxID=2530199 RepID=UPI001F0CDF9E|nr:hypothetical protein [Acidaminobacter sp. JC074]MCH4890904.1 hypothetical protein [Acidaminobacter sp. JC074]
MKKLINYLKRYYQCIFKYDLFRDYFKEPKLLAVLFVIPMFIAFTILTYMGTIQTPDFIQSSFDPYYDLISNTTYEEIIDFEELEEGEVSPWTVSPDDTVNIQFLDSKLVLEQSKVLDKAITKDDVNYRIIIDSNNTYELALNEDREYSTETKELLGFKQKNMVVYVADDFAILSVKGGIYNYDLSGYTKDFDTTESIYHFLNENYVNKGMMLQFSGLTSLFLFAMYYLVVYFVMRSLLKRHDFELSRDRKFKIIFYNMQPGLYVYFILTILLSASQMALSFLVPLASVLTMFFVNTKTIDLVRDYVRKEKKAEKRLKRNQ